MYLKFILEQFYELYNFYIYIYVHFVLFLNSALNFSFLNLFNFNFLDFISSTPIFFLFGTFFLFTIIFSFMFISYLGLYGVFLINLVSLFFF